MAPPVVYIVGDGKSSLGYTRMFRENGWLVTDRLASADMVQFIGGADVSPSIYGQPRHKTTRPNLTRDRAEMIMFNWCKRNGIPTAGICRGGQFLNVMCGGALWQHVNNHDKGNHIATDVESGRAFTVTSTHHQMMIPGPDSVDVLIATHIASFKEKMNKNGNEVTVYNDKVDREAIAYPSQKVFCFQPHPEFNPLGDTADLYFNYLKKWLNLGKGVPRIVATS